MNLAQLIDDLSKHISNKFMVSFNGQHDTFLLIISPSQNGGKSKRRIDKSLQDEHAVQRSIKSSSGFKDTHQGAQYANQAIDFFLRKISHPIIISFLSLFSQHLTNE